MYFIGVDHHKQFSVMTVLDEQGKEVRTARLQNTRFEVESLLRELGKEPFTAVVEAGRSSYVMADLLRELGGEVKMANPSQVKAIAHARIKTDKRDSEKLAHLLRMGYIPEVYQRSSSNREAQRVIRLRAFWINLRSQVKNKLRALLAQQDEEVQQAVAERESRLFSGKGQEFLKGLRLKGKDGEIRDVLLKAYGVLEGFIKESDELVERLYQELPEAQLLDSLPGFARTLSVLAAVEIGEISRFSRAESLEAYAGLIPSTHGSGDRTHHGHIIKQGNSWLRWAMVEAVHPALKVDFGLNLFYQRLKQRKGPNVAKVATARRLTTIAFHMLKEKRTYIPYPEKTSAA